MKASSFTLFRDRHIIPIEFNFLMTEQYVLAAIFLQICRSIARTAYRLVEETPKFTIRLLCCCNPKLKKIFASATATVWKRLERVSISRLESIMAELLRVTS
jgi:hypothetical protein